MKSIAIAETNPAGRPVSFRIADANGRKVLWESEDLRYAVNAGAAGSVDAARAAFVARQPMGRLGSAEEIAALAVYLAGDAAQFVTGQAIVVDGGVTLIGPER